MLLHAPKVGGSLEAGGGSGGGSCMLGGIGNEAVKDMCMLCLKLSVPITSVH